jgi:uncharacterized membrane protein YsdA (DUF1294 family)
VSELRTIIIGALLAANLLALGAFGLDKLRAATGAWRTRESTLLWLGWLGPVGAWLGVLLVRHKTRKARFLLGLAAATLLSPGWAAAWLLLR